MAKHDSLLVTAERNASLLAERGIDAVVIGAAALAALIALKLYAGGMKSKADVVELLKRNPNVDRKPIRADCRQVRLRGLEPLIHEADATG